MIGITSNDNGVGMSRDIRIIRELILEPTEFFSHAKKPITRFKAVIHVEMVNSRSFRQAHKHFIIPNPEWFLGNWTNSKGRFKAALCKTKDGQRIFNQLGFNTVFIGFTSEDRYLETPLNSKVPEFLHIVGKSQFKGTPEIIEAWKPNYPKLHIYVQHDAYQTSKNNIVIHKGFVEDDELKVIQNKYLYHLQLSIVEGFGHVILESMSTGAILLTTDAPPMNEYFSKDIGFLADYGNTEGYNFGTKYFPTVASIQNNVEAMLKCKDIERRSLAMRQTFVDKDKTFRDSFYNMLNSLL